MLNTFTFNGHSSDEFGIRIEKMPVLNRSARKFQVASVPGGNGNIYQLEDAWNEVVQPYQIFAGNSADGAAVTSFTDILEWLHSADDYAVLSDTYDTTHYRKAIFIDNVDIESMWHTYGRATINFRCRPEHFITEPEITVAKNSNVQNSTNHIAKPLITLVGSGAQNLKGANSRQIAYGAPYLTRLHRNAINKIYSGVHYLATDGKVPCDDTAVTFGTGDPSVGKYVFTTSAYGYGFGLPIAVQPNSTYTLSFNLSGDGFVAVHFYDRARKYMNSRSASASGDTEFTFTTPYGCGWALVTIAGESGTYTVMSFMINHGSEALPFNAAATAEERVIINDTVMIISESFISAVIDCEDESVWLEGAQCDYAVQVQNEYGELSPDYLRLVPGANNVRYTATSCTMDRRLWNL